ncbi:hypothetical protein CCAE64S_00372 [Castellaniella caeni]
MPAIHEVATLTSKGQITLPKSIWQALGADTGSKLAFELRGDEVVVTRADAEHDDPCHYRVPGSTDGWAEPARRRSGTRCTGSVAGEGFCACWPDIAWRRWAHQ